MEARVATLDAGLRGNRVVIAPDGGWAVAGDWEVTLDRRGERVVVGSRERLAGGLRFDGERLWVGGDALDLASGEWQPLPPLRPSVSPEGGSDVEVHDTAWVGPGHLAVAAAHAQPPRRQGSEPWLPWERLVVVDAESRELEAVLQEAGPAPPVRHLAAVGETLVAGGQGLRAWRDLAAEAVWLIPLGVPQIEAVALRADGLVAAAAPAGRDVILCSPEGSLFRELPGTAGTTALAMHPRAAVVAVGGLEGVELRTLDGEALASAGTETPVVDLAFDEADDRLLVLAAEGLTELSLRDWARA